MPPREVYRTTVDPVKLQPLWTYKVAPESQVVGPDGRIYLDTVPAGRFELLVTALGAATTSLWAEAPGDRPRAVLEPAAGFEIVVPALAEDRAGEAGVTPEARKGRASSPGLTRLFGGSRRLKTVSEDDFRRSVALKNFVREIEAGGGSDTIWGS